MKYRLYIDEVGNADLDSASDDRHQYLSLTGVMLDLDHVSIVAHHDLEALKERFFDSHPDDPVVLHRKEIVNKAGAFRSLEDPELAEEFGNDLLALLRAWDFTVITVTIDKREHLRRYAVWQHHPYHYCMQAMMERYVRRLERLGSLGDVMAESRGPREDKLLKEAFERIYSVTTRTKYLSAERMERSLTSRQIKLRKKDRNICGLQIADLVAHPSWRAMMAARSGEPMPNGFGREIARILIASKYDRSPEGKIHGWGWKWLP